MAPDVDKKRKRCTSVCKEFAKLNAFPAFETYGNIVRVIVGKGKKQRDFSVHNGLICAASSYFHAAFNGNFKEGIEGTVHLDEDKPAVFKNFLSWLYTRQLPTPDPSAQGIDFESLIDLHIFADARGIKALKIATIDAVCDLIAEHWTGPAIDSITLVYRNTPKGVGMRKVMVDIIRKAQESILIGGAETASPEFVIEYAVALEKDLKTRNISREEWCKIDRCAYHEHEKGDMP